jgi:hypothetical protein
VDTKIGFRGRTKQELFDLVAANDQTPQFRIPLHTAMDRVCEFDRATQHPIEATERRLDEVGRSRRLTFLGGVYGISVTNHRFIRQKRPNEIPIATR